MCSAGGRGSERPVDEACDHVRAVGIRDFVARPSICESQEWGLSRSEASRLSSSMSVAVHRLPAAGCGICT